MINLTIMLFVNKWFLPLNDLIKKSGFNFEKMNLTSMREKIKNCVEMRIRKNHIVVMREIQFVFI